MLDFKFFSPVDGEFIEKTIKSIKKKKEMCINIDPYKEMASEIFNVPYDEVTDDQRLEAKRKHYFNRYTSGWKI